MSTALDKSINIARRWRRQSCGWSWVVLLDGSEIMADREWSWVVAAKLSLFVDGHAWSHGLLKPLLGRILRTTFFASQKARQVVIIKYNNEFMNSFFSKKKKKKMEGKENMNKFIMGVKYRKRKICNSFCRHILCYCN